MPDERTRSLGGEGPDEPRTPHDGATTDLAADQIEAAPPPAPRIPAETVGSEIGPYKLVELLGEGGFGSVFLAEQSKPVTRRVALKIIKLGMDTRAVIARFEAERQALAVMDHPNIARVLDAGATDTGRPYFVMELVKGRPINEYCDDHKLAIDARLELFAQVCAAVQHAHTKGIIHRDIKPSNVLVSEHDGKPFARVIDFGIAKATASRLTEKTVFTQQQQIIGTPEYMSPEQAQGSLDIDTRTDVYSLGVLLYQLLTGSTPFSETELRSAAYDEIRRIIREVDPPRPSTRLSQHADTLASVAALRRTEPKRLGTLIRGELDWIVMKAMEKDRARRYETANGLAADVRRFLSGEPVMAAPPSTAYRLRKFVTRHRGPVLAGGVVALALVTATGVSVWFAASEARQREEAERQKTLAETHAAAEAKARARAEAINTFVTRALNSGDPMQSGRRDTTIAQAMGNAVNEIESGAFKHDPATEASLRDTIGVILKNQGKYDQARALVEQAAAINERLANGGDSSALALSLHNLGEISFGQDDFANAGTFYKRAMEMFERIHGPEHRDVAGSMNGLGTVYFSQQRYDEAEPLLIRSLAIREKILGPEHRDVALALNDLALVYSAQGRPADAEPLLVRALSIYEKALGPDHADLAACLNTLALLYDDQGQYARAEPLYARALAICEKSLGPEHPIVGIGLHNLADCLRHTGKLDESEAMFARALAAREKTLGPDDPDVAVTLNNFALLREAQERHAEAEALYLRVLVIDEKNFGPEHPEVAADLNNIAQLHARQRRFDRAEEFHLKALAIREKTLGPDHFDVVVSLNNLGMLYKDKGDPGQGEPLLVRALQTIERTRGRVNPSFATVLANLARARQAMGETGAARRDFDEVIAIYRRVAPPGGGPLFARALWSSGTARLDAGDAAGALPELEEAVAMGERVLTPAPNDQADLSKFREAHEKCKEALGK